MFLFVLYPYTFLSVTHQINEVGIQKDMKCSCSWLFFVGLDKNCRYSEMVGPQYMCTVF